MTIEERAQSYARTFPTRPPMQVVSEGEGKERRAGCRDAASEAV